MSVRPLRYLGDPILRTPSDPVTKFGGLLAALVTDLLDTVREPGRAGLAANQIGSSLAVFAYNVDGQHGYVINPKLVELDGNLEGPEACLSVPGIVAARSRAAHAVVEGVDLRQEPVTVAGTGELARTLQHETDHLQGELFIDALEGAERRRVMRLIHRRELNGLRSVLVQRAPVADFSQPEAEPVVGLDGAVRLEACGLVEAPRPRIGVKYPERDLLITGLRQALERRGHERAAVSLAPCAGRKVNREDLADCVARILVPGRADVREADDRSVAVGRDQRPAAGRVRVPHRPSPALGPRGRIEAIQIVLRYQTAVSRLPRPHMHFSDLIGVIDVSNPDLHQPDGSSGSVRLVPSKRASQDDGGLRSRRPACDTSPVPARPRASTAGRALRRSRTGSPAAAERSP